MLVVPGTIEIELNLENSHENSHRSDLFLVIWEIKN